MNRVFVEIEVQRTQAYLSRSLSLRGRRGASALLLDLHRHLADLAPGPGGTTWRREDSAPAIDGKLVLVADPAGDELDDAGVEAEVRRLTAALRRRLPAVELHAQWYRGRDHLADRPDPDDPTVGHLVSLPPRPEWPLARPCDRCGIDPAIVEVPRPEPGRVCRDCKAREDAGGDSSPHEKDLAETFRELGHEVAIVRDLSQLAGAGPTETVRRNGSGGTARRSLKRNHLATVFIDANQLGATVRRLAAETPETERGAAVAAFSRAVADAVATALEHAAIVVHDQAGTPDVATTVPHVKGGDDVLVTVPAALWVPFTLTYLDRFHGHLAEQGHALTASAAVVVAHHKHPFHHVVDVADELLTRTKARLGGTSAGIGWVDLTDERPDTHEPVSLDWVHEHE
ncbi:MAG: hypothetical protein D6683_16655, partial [Actinomyces sp.]